VFVPLLMFLVTVFGEHPQTDLQLLLSLLRVLYLVLEEEKQSDF
jgi:hypothetical protein